MTHFTTHTLEYRSPVDGQESFNTLVDLLCVLELPSDARAWLELMLMQCWM